MKRGITTLLKASSQRSQQCRHFSTGGSGGGYMRSSPLAGMQQGSFIQDDEFLPDLEKKEIEHQQKMESSISVKKKPDDMLRHGEEFGGVTYKYDLPTVNSPIIFRSQQLALKDENQIQTGVENLLDQLQVDKDTSYESFVIKMNQTFNNEVDMYGDIRKAGESNLKVLEFGIPIPWETINDEVTMKTIRSMARYNPDIPGAIELVHPNKFLPNLRSVEEFRNTPIIPISEKDLAAHRRKVEEANRKGYYVEIKKDTLYFYMIVLLSLGIIGYAFMMVNEKTMDIKKNIDRTKMLKFKANSGTQGGNIQMERARENIEQGRSLF